VQVLTHDYQLAEVVLAWLGDEDERVPLAFETMELLSMLLITSTEAGQDNLEWLREEPSLCEDDELKLDVNEIDRNKRWASLVYFFNWCVFERVAAAKNSLLATDPRHAILVSTLAGSFRATSPKDYVYGLLGITGLPIKPDYSASISVADIYCDYVSTCLERFPIKTEWNLDELCFLPQAGIRLFANTESHPS
jgi:hypothetical protein